jgi:dipeptidyl aminopeptidase/acylaminoacyl peptidase
VPFGIYRIDPGGKPVRLSTSRQDEYPAWSPDGKSVAFDQAIKPGNPKSDCRLAVVAAGGGASHAVPGVTAACRAFSWGRNGLIAFNDPKNAVWVVRSDGSGLRKLVGASADALNPAWSPDGRLLAFGNGVFGGLQVVGSNGKGLHAITNPQAGPADGYPAWSPDGKTIAFARTNPTDFTVSIMVARPDGTGIRRLVKLMQDVSVARPSWTPDGSSIVYADPFGIAFVPVAGGAHRILVHGMYDQPAVAPK